MNTLLPPLDDRFTVTPDQLEHYRKNGWTIIRGLAKPDEARAYAQVINEAAMRHNRETRPLEERDTYGRAFLQIMNLWHKEPDVARYTLSRRFAGVAAQLLGCEKVRLYHDQALFKEPGGGHTPWHQDGFFWPVDQANSVTMWMPLVDISSEMGSMSFADGSQNEGLIPIEEGISDNTESFYDEYVKSHGLPVRTSGAMAAGDATFHSGLTLHKAPGNPTDRVRAVMTVIYLADGMRVQQPENPNQQSDLGWMPGLKPGDLIDTEMNPALG